MVVDSVRSSCGLLSRRSVMSSMLRSSLSAASLTHDHYLHQLKIPLRNGINFCVIECREVRGQRLLSGLCQFLQQPMRLARLLESIKSSANHRILSAHGWISSQNLLDGNQISSVIHLDPRISYFGLGWRIVWTRIFISYTYRLYKSPAQIPWIDYWLILILGMCQ